MENKYQLIKEKFGLLIHYLVKYGFTPEFIEHKVIHDPFFNCFENNNDELFQKSSVEDIICNVFGMEVHINHSLPAASELCWAGQMYISLLLNYSVPIQRAVLVLPIKKMISLFNPYHEMNENKLCERYMEEEKNTSVFRLIVDRDITIRKLSILTGINQNTLLSYVDNDKLFSMSASNVYKLSNYFNIPFSIFCKESNYCVDVSPLLVDDSFKKEFLGVLKDYLLIKDADEILLSNKRQPTAKYQFIQSENTLMKRSGTAIRKKELSEDEIKLIYKETVVRFKKTLPTGMLLF